MNPGYVYVMINQYMPGIVKIGKTTDAPEKRAKDLSSATGVPTPFLLAYYIKVDDCDRFEKQIHQILEKKRVNENREFFQISSTEAINTIIYSANSESNLSITQNMISNSSISPICQEYIKLGNDYLKGENGKFQDETEAVLYYKKAARLKSVEACYQLGMIIRKKFCRYRMSMRPKKFEKEKEDSAGYFRKALSFNDDIETEGRILAGLFRLYMYGNDIHNMNICFKNVLQCGDGYAIDDRYIITSIALPYILESTPIEDKKEMIFKYQDDIIYMVTTISTDAGFGLEDEESVENVAKLNALKFYRKHNILYYNNYTKEKAETVINAFKPIIPDL